MFLFCLSHQQPELLTMYELIMFFIERSGGNLKPIQTRDPRVLRLPDNLYEHRFAQCKYGVFNRWLGLMVGRINSFYHSHCFVSFFIITL